MTLEDGLVRVLSSKIAASTPAALLIANYLRILPTIDWSDERAPGATAAYATLTGLVEAISIHFANRAQAAMRNGITPEYLDKIVDNELPVPLEKNYLLTKLKGGFFEVTGQDKKRAIHLEERMAKSPSRILQHYLFKDLIRAGRLEDAFDMAYSHQHPSQLSNSITSKLSPRSIKKYNYITTVGENILHYENFLKNPVQKRALNFYQNALLTAMDYSNLGLEEKAEEVWITLSDTFLDDAIPTLLYSRYLALHNRDDDYTKAIVETLRRIVTGDHYTLEQIESTKNPVYKVVNNTTKDDVWLNKMLIIKGADDYATFEAELNNNIRLAEELSSENYCTPTPLAIIENDIDTTLPQYLYLMEQDRGDPLMTVLEERRPDANLQLNRATDFLAHYHATTPIQADTINYAESLESRLHDNLHESVKSLAKSVANNLTPIVSDLERTITVANKDAHPNNFRVTQDGRLMIIDTEQSYGTSQLIDLANLLEYSGRLPFAEKMDQLDRYVAKFNENSDKNMKVGPALRRKYLNAVIYRSLSYLGYLESKPSEVKYELNWVRSGLNAINRLRTDFKKYYDENQGEYTVLQSFLSRMHAALQGRMTKDELPSTDQPGRILPGRLLGRNALIRGRLYSHLQ